MENNEDSPTGLDIVADFDFSDAPSWAIPREWFINQLYDLENEEI